MRTTWETFSPIDPILTEKMREHVAVRRERFTKYVRVTVAGCLALCIIALILSFVSGGEGSASAASPEASTRKNVPSVAQTSVEKLDLVRRNKASWRHRR